MNLHNWSSVYSGLLQVDTGRSFRELERREIFGINSRQSGKMRNSRGKKLHELRFFRNFVMSQMFLGSLMTLANPRHQCLCPLLGVAPGEGRVAAKI